MKEKRYKKCGLSANDVPRPENFRLSEEGLCNICMMEKYQAVIDGKDPLQRFIDEWAVGEPISKSEYIKEVSKILSILIEIIKEKENGKDLKEVLEILRESFSDLTKALSHKHSESFKDLIIIEEYLKSLLNISKRLNKK